MREGLIDLLVAAVSQVLIILFWKDAKFGTVMNVAILLVSILSLGHYSFQQQVQQETSYLLSQHKLSTEKVVSENDIADLPIPVQKWLRHSGMMGKPYINIGKVTQQAEMQLKPDQQNWMKGIGLGLN